jgi:apolipoprotein N-acyltransferase
LKGAAWRTPAAGVVSGILFALAFPPYGRVLLLPLALVPWLVALTFEGRRGRALLSGLLFGLAYWCLSIPWITYVVTRFGGQGSAMGVVCLVLLAAILAEWPAAVAFAAVGSAPRGSARRLAVFPVLWMASEHLRSFVYGGFPWNLTAHALYRRPVWLQTASIGGVSFVGGLVVAVSCLLAAAAAFRRARPVVAAAVLVAVAGAFGAWRLARPEAPPPASAVALLQPNVSQEARLGAGAAEEYGTVIRMAQAAAEAKPALIVIPESAFPLYWDRSPRLRHDLAAIAARSEGLVIFNDVEELPDGRYFNVARLLGPNGLVGPPYRKVHRVPFGEYVPLPKLFFFVRQVSTEIGEFSAAAAPTALGAPGGRFRIGVGVCYEILYAGLVREEVGRLGANLLVTISNDSWYGRAGAQEQHFAGAVLRAVETNRYLLRAAITGISGIVDEKGRILGELPRDTTGILRGTARPEDRQTIWTRWGYWLPRLADVAAAAVLLFALALGRPKEPS